MVKKMIITNNIRRFRFFADQMSQFELAERCGVSRQAIISIETGKYNPSLELALRIADAFGVNVSEIFEYKFEENEAEK